VIKPLRSIYITLLCGGYETKYLKVLRTSGMEYFGKTDTWKRRGDA
jgi:hypothetical protein